MLHYYWCKHCLYYPVWRQICLDLFIFSVFVCSSPVTGYNWSAWGSISILPPSAACIVDLDPAMCDTSVSHPSGWEKKTCRQIPLQAHRRRSKPCTAHLVRELNSSPDFSWVSFQYGWQKTHHFHEDQVIYLHKGQQKSFRQRHYFCSLGQRGKRSWGIRW